MLNLPTLDVDSQNKSNKMIINSSAYVRPVPYLQGPSTFCGVIKQRFQLFKRDVAENWFVVNVRKSEARQRRESQMHKTGSAEVNKATTNGVARYNDLHVNAG